MTDEVKEIIDEELADGNYSVKYPLDDKKMTNFSVEDKTNNLSHNEKFSRGRNQLFKITFQLKHECYTIQTTLKKLRKTSYLTFDEKNNIYSFKAKDFENKSQFYDINIVHKLKEGYAISIISQVNNKEISIGDSGVFFVESYEELPDSDTEEEEEENKNSNENSRFINLEALDSFMNWLGNTKFFTRLAKGSKSKKQSNTESTSKSVTESTSKSSTNPNTE